MPKYRIEINRKRLIKKAISLGILNAKKLSNKSLLNIVNRNNINKKLIRIFNGLGKRTTFTNSELDKTIELDGLEINDLKKIAKLRKINNYSYMTKNMLYYVLVMSEKSPLENSYLKHLEYTTTNDFKKRLNHIKVLATRLNIKITNVERLKLYEKINEFKRKYVETKNHNIRGEVIQEVVNITNNLYNTKTTYKTST